MYAPLSTLILDIWLIRSLRELRGLELINHDHVPSYVLSKKIKNKPME